jgi:hypothetical protein
MGGDRPNKAGFLHNSRNSRLKSPIYYPRVDAVRPDSLLHKRACQTHAARETR